MRFFADFFIKNPPIFLERIDGKGFFMYNRKGMDKGREKPNRKWWRICLCALLTAACGAFICWIFSNSLKTAEESSVQSGGVVEKIQAFFARFAPHSFVATAKGEDYDKLHKIIRILAHFSEFALLGALLIWCLRAYTGKGIFLLIPLALILLVPVVDELLQSFTGGRAMQFIDIVVDVAGGICGGAFALLTLRAGKKIVEKKGKKEENGKRELTSRVD